MTDSIFGKFILITASVLGILGGANYIQITEAKLDFNFKTGNNFPIYYFLNVQNIGPGKARFDVSSNVNWLFVYREGQQQQTDFVSVELPQYIPINFVLEVHPERLNIGTHSAQITVKVVNLNDFTVLETKEIPVVLNKDTEAIPTPMLTLLPTGIAEIPLISPTVTLTSSPTAEEKLTPKPAGPTSPKISPRPRRGEAEGGPTIAPEKIRSVIRPFEQLLESLRSLVRFLFRR